MIRNRRILIVSPQAWQGLQLSKHHYAAELAKLGNEVFFLNPPSGGTLRPRLSRAAPDGVVVVDYRTILRGHRFLPPRARHYFEALQVRIIERALGSPIDVLWSFDSTRLTNLRLFRAPLRLFHAADRADPKVLDDIGNSADVVFSVSDFILNDFAPYRCPRFFVNHGLPDEYAERARRRLKQLDSLSDSVSESRVRVGYVGNLLRPDIDHSAFTRIVDQTRDAAFHVWGPYEYSHLDWKHAGEPATRRFIDFLQRRDNVKLYGLRPPGEIADQLGTMDVLLICYDPAREMNRASNNHKVLEYLSTGKVIVTNHVSTYARAGTPDGLLEMPPTLDNSSLPMLFADVIANLRDRNTTSRQRVRITYALANTYSAQLQRIEQLLDSLH